ncbi:hypothetical protein BLOT_005064 [Blomia tropicalis]|nr:hypothetical protein BLOT_005064 [Blomia tropicalis]
MVGECGATHLLVFNVNDEIGSSNRVKCIIMSLNASSKPVLYRESLAQNNKHKHMVYLRV